MSNSKIKVWDIFIRFFHWTLVFTFIVSYLTEGENNLHFYAGWYIIILLSLRIIWGFIGTKHARFSDFVKPPSDIIAYAKSIIASDNNPVAKHRGHNPLGGLMVLGLILSLSATCYSGVMLYSTESESVFSFLDKPLLAETDEHEKEFHDDNEDHDTEEFWEETHEFFANITLLLIFLHIAGVVFSSKRQQENLIKSMITGKKEN